MSFLDAGHIVSSMASKGSRNIRGREEGLVPALMSMWTIRSGDKSLFPTSNVIQLCNNNASQSPESFEVLPDIQNINFAANWNCLGLKTVRGLPKAGLAGSTTPSL